MKLMQFKSSINSCSFLWLSDYIINDWAVVLFLKDFSVVDSRVSFSLAYGYLNTETRTFEEDPSLNLIEDISLKTSLMSIVNSSIDIYQLHESAPEEVTIH